MTEPEEVRIDLIYPKVPELKSHDINKQAAVASPDDNCVKDIKVVLAGFKSTIQDFF
jgi:hypothetical protein